MTNVPTVHQVRDHIPLYMASLRHSRACSRKRNLQRNPQAEITLAKFDRLVHDGDGLDNAIRMDLATTVAEFRACRRHPSSYKPCHSNFQTRRGYHVGANTCSAQSRPTLPFPQHQTQSPQILVGDVDSNVCGTPDLFERCPFQEVAQQNSRHQIEPTTSKNTSAQY